MKIKDWSVGLLCLVLPGMVLADSELKFDASGRPANLLLGGKELLRSDTSSGFILHHANGKDVTNTPLNRIATTGDTIKVSDADGKTSFTFEIAPYPNHLTIQLLEAHGIGTGRDFSVSLEIDSTAIAAYALNDLATANFEGRKKKTTEMKAGRKNTVLSWPYLWGRQRPDGTHGSLVLYDDRLEGSARDAVLAEIWSVEGTAGRMVRPAGQKTWTEADVLAWVDRWVAKFSKIAKVSVDAANPKELYEFTDKYVIPSGANRVYMFSNVWRGEYHLDSLSNTGVNSNIFPKGKADLIAYSNYLAKHGAHLQLKSLGPQVGKNDTRYFSPTKADHRIMTWVKGTLVEDVNENDKTLRFRPGQNPITMRDDMIMRLGEELVEAKKITVADNGVWTLEGCNRGYGASASKPHPAGTEMAGYVQSNKVFNFEDDFGRPNSLAEQVCGEYGDFLNDVNVGHLHFDGTGRMGMTPWYVRDFTDYVYSRVDQPVTGSTVGGGIEANFEKMFSAAKAIAGATGYRDIRVGPRLHQTGRKHTEFAPSLLDLHFDASDGVRLGSRRPSLEGGQSGGALSMTTLATYGLTPEALVLYENWIELAPVFDDKDADYVAGFLQKGGNHYQGEDVLVLEKNNKGEFIFTPHRVMGRTSGKDEPFTIDQEWGAVPRFQEIAVGTTMELSNPNEAQEPQVVIFVREGSAPLKDPLIQIDGGGLSVKGEIQPTEYLKFEGGGKIQVYDKNWNKLRTLPALAKSFTVKTGANTLTVASGAESDKASLRVQFITKGPVHVLVSNKHLKANRSK